MSHIIPCFLKLSQPFAKMPPINLLLRLSSVLNMAKCRPHVVCFYTAGSSGEGRRPNSVVEESRRSTPELDRPAPRDLVHAPLPPTWRRSSLPTEDPNGLEELRMHASGENPANRLLPPSVSLNVGGATHWGGGVKPRRDLRRSSLCTGAQGSGPAIIDVRKNPV